MLGHFELDAGRFVGKTPAGFNLVDVLPARPAATAAAFFDVLHLDMDFDIVKLGQHRHRCRASVNAALRFRFGHPLHAMATAFELEGAVSRIADDAEDDFLESAALAVGKVVHAELEALDFGVSAVHFIEIASKEGRLLTAGAGADFNEEPADWRFLGGDEGVLGPFHQILQPHLHLRQFGGGHLGHLPIVGGLHLSQFNKLLSRSGIVIERVRRPRKLTALAADGDQPLRVGQHRRVVHLLGEFRMP